MRLNRLVIRDVLVIRPMVAILSLSTLIIVNNLTAYANKAMTTPIIRLSGVHHTYNPDTPAAVHALRGVDLDILPGEYVVILGHNGCGKSTLAKHLNALLLPTEGDVVVNGWNTKDRDHWYDIRATVGMVFQTPDNQFVATIVEEDIAFGPENLGLPRDEIRSRVEDALE